MGRRGIGLALGAGLALVGSACSSLAVKPAVAVRTIAVDLAFGAAGSQPGPIPEVPRKDPFGDDDDFRGGPPGPPCPFPLPCFIRRSAVRHPLVPSIGLEHRPREGGYLMRARASAVGTGTVFSTHRITDVADVTVPPGISTEDLPEQRPGFAYTWSDGLTGIVARFRAVPGADPSGTDTEVGFLLERIGWPASLGGVPDMDDDVSKALGSVDGLLEPAHPLRLLNFPVGAGQEQTSAGYDPRTRALLVSETHVRGPDNRVRGCLEYAAGYDVEWKLTVYLPDGDADEDVLMRGRFWFATQYGGWPVKADYRLEGDLLEGRFQHTIHYLDPVG